MLATLALLAAGCGGAGDDRSSGEARETPEAPSGPATAVQVALESFSISAEPAQAPAGTLTFELTATGFHNFVVIKTELDPEDLPLRSPAGPVLTDTESTEVIGVVPIPFEGEDELTVDAGPGDYVLICNTEPTT